MLDKLTIFAQACSEKQSFLRFPTWYKYLPKAEVTEVLTGQVSCTPQVNSLQDVWLIGAAILDILLRVAALLAVFYIIVGGVQYIKSQGQPDETQKAKNTILYAIVGLVVAIASTVLVTFVAGRFS